MGRTGSSRVRRWRPTRSRPAVRATVVAPGDLIVLPGPTGLLARKAGRMGAGHREEIRNRARSEEHTSELQSHLNLVCRLLLEKKKKKKIYAPVTQDARGNTL